jgi:hypothetical protein
VSTPPEDDQEIGSKHVVVRIKTRSVLGSCVSGITVLINFSYFIKAISLLMRKSSLRS